ncbi:MAG: hypothetical protein WCL27_05865 [Betaproteobacteria bacterium]
MRPRTHHLVFITLLLLCTSAALYLPWRDNPLIFDDSHILKSTALSDYALNPFSLMPRQFPYFTLGFENVISNGDLHVSRYVNFVLHGINAFLLFLLGNRLLNGLLTPRRTLLTALAMAMLFVLHPVAVYAVGYLVQRTILLSTLFLLIAALQFDQALSDRSWRRALVAGLCFGFAAMSKEHAVTGLLCILGIALLHKSFSWAKSGPAVLAFMATGLPFAVWITCLKAGWVATAYEPDALDIISNAGFPDAGSPFGNWLLSIAMQCLFFFRYLSFWWWPNPSGMSIDIRPDFSTLSGLPWIIIGPLVFFGLMGLLVCFLFSLKIRQELRIAAYGMLWAMSLFIVELSSVRFQEPLVLYRSYLWAPGFLLALAGLLSLVPPRIAMLLAMIGVLTFAPLSWGRLSTFSDELKLWEEAALNLPIATTPGALRIHYNRGLFLARSNQIEAAQEDLEWVINHSPQTFHGYYGRSLLHIYKKDFANAAIDLETVVRINPTFGTAYFRLGLVLRKLGKSEESESAFLAAEALGIPRLVFK